MTAPSPMRVAALGVAFGALLIGSIGSNVGAAPLPEESAGAEVSRQQTVVDVGGSVGPALTGVTDTGAVMSLDALTGSGGIELDRGDAVRSITVPVPAGLALTEIRTDAAIAAGGAATTLVIGVNGNEVARLTLPDTTSAIRLPVDATADGEVLVTLALLDGGCGTDVGSSSIVLSNIGFGFTGTPEVPATIAEFLPAVMASAVIVEPFGPTDAEKNATYALAAALARRYPVAPAISIVRDGGGEPAQVDPFERVFDISEAAADTLSVVRSGAASVLEISGTAERLPDTAASMASGDLVLLTSAVSDDPPAPSEIDRGQLTGVRDLIDLDVDDTERVGAASLDVVVPLPQSAFGEPVARLRLELSGIASSGGATAPVVSLTVNDRLVELVEVDANGAFAVEVEIPPREMRRDNVVVLRSEVPPCDPAVGSHRLVVSTSSTVDATPGQSLAPSLDRFPQVALAQGVSAEGIDGGIVVAAGPSALEQQVAATMIAALQTASPFAIRTAPGDVVSTVAGQRPALVVSEPTDDIATALRDAEVPGAGDEFAPGLGVIVALDTDVLVVTLNGGPGATIQLLSALNGSGWSSFVGRIIGFDETGARTAVDAQPSIEVELPAGSSADSEPGSQGTASAPGDEESPQVTAVVTLESPASAGDSSAVAAAGGGAGDDESSVLEPFLIGLFVSLLLIVAIFVIRSFFRMITGRSIRN